MPRAHDPSRRGFLAAAAGAAAGAALAPSPLAAHPAAPGDDVRRLMRIARVPGLALVEVAAGRATVEAFGVRRAGDPAPVAADTIFQAASLTKQVAAYVVHRLAMDGVLDLDRPVHEYLALPDPDDGRSRAITPRLLLAHAGGWRNWRFSPQQRLTADFVPGASWGYSGEGYFFLQRVVESLLKQPFARVVRERAFAPIGMASSALVWSPAMDARLAAAHNRRGEPFETFHVRTVTAARAAREKAGLSPDEWTVDEAVALWPTLEGSPGTLPNNLLPNAAASLFTTPADYGAFVRHLLHDPVGRQVLDRMLAPVARIDPELGWGAGVGLELEGGRTRFWQWGDNGGFKHFLLGDPRSRRAWVVFTNGDAGAAVYQRVLRARTGGDHAAWLIV